MGKQASFLTDAVAAADELTDAQLKALLIWYRIYWGSSAPFKGISFRKWLDYVLKTGDVK